MTQQLRPLVFELHTDQRGGKSGLIQAGDDNPVHSALRSAYGAPWDPNNYGSTKFGVSLLELSATPDNWDSTTVDAAAQKLYSTLMSVEGVKSGARPLHFFSGHGDVTTGQTGAPGEKGYVKAVRLRLKELASGNKNFSFYDSITDPNDTSRTSGDESTTNWGRGQKIIQTWKPGEVVVATADSEDPTPGVETPEGETPGIRSQAVERAKQFKKTPLTADDVVDGFGNDFDKMKSGRLAAALKGAQTSIIQDRMDKGESFGTKQVEVEAPADTQTPETPKPTAPTAPEPTAPPTTPKPDEEEE